jgi:hypothetical protein
MLNEAEVSVFSSESIILENVHFTNWCKYQRNVVVHHIDPDDGGGGDV